MKTILEKILVEPVFEKQGTIVIPDTIKRTTNKGSVISVGQKITEINIGDIVIFRGGDPISIEGKEYIVVDSYNILAII